MKMRSQVLKTSITPTGFTLIELLVAMVITSVVVTLGGVGLIAMTSANQRSEAESSRRIELNRALDFIADEIRSAITVSAGGDTEVLSLKTSAGTTSVYSVAPTSDNDWLGPQIINRSIGGNSQVLVDTISGSNAPSCATGTRSPVTAPTGFYACLDNPANARIVDLYLRGQLPDGKIYVVNTKVFRRSNQQSP